MLSTIIYKALSITFKQAKLSTYLISPLLNNTTFSFYKEATKTNQPIQPNRFLFIPSNHENQNSSENQICKYLRTSSAKMHIRKSRTCFQIKFIHPLYLFIKFFTNNINNTDTTRTQTY